MKNNLKFKATFISLLLLVSSCSLFIIPTVKTSASPAIHGTTLYFHENTVANHSLPVKENYSVFPPSITDTEEWLTWVTLALLGGKDFSSFVIYEDYYYEGDKKVVAGDIKFDLFFSSNIPSKIFFKDKLKISLLKNYVEIDNTTITINPELFDQKIQKHEFIIEDVDFTLNSGDFLTFAIELIPTEKPIGMLIKQGDEEVINETLNVLKDKAELVADLLVNQSFFPQLRDFGRTIKDFLNLSDDIGDIEDSGLNITLEDIANLANTLRSSSFIYDSVEYPSSVTLPFRTPGEEENIVNYYLHEGNVMDAEQPLGEQAAKIVLSKNDNVGSWTGPELERSKILKRASANIYLNYRDLLSLINLIRGRIPVIADLYVGDKLIDSEEVNLDRTTILDIFDNSKDPIIFNFDELNDSEVPYEDSLNLRVYIKNGTKFGLGLYRNVQLLYDSIDYPSGLNIRFGETDHITIENINGEEIDKKEILEEIVAAGGSAKFNLNVSSKYNDNISVSITDADEENWDVNYPTESITISAGSNILIPVFVNSTNPDLSAYGSDSIDLTMAVSGLTGKDSRNILVSVSEDAVEYDVDILAPSNKNIRHGESDTYKFVIKNNNTGVWPDSYTVKVESEHDWQVDHEQFIEDVENYNLDGNEVLFDVKVHVPSFTEVKKDKLTLTIISNESEAHNKETSFTVSVTTKVISPNILEQVYHVFDSAAKDMDLDSILGDYAGIFLLLLTIILIVFFVVIGIYLARKSYLDLVCLERVKQIPPDGQAVFGISVHNPSNRVLTYEASTERLSDSTNWEITVDKETLVVEPKQSEVIQLIVKPTDMVEPGDWVEVKISVKALEKHKVKELTTVTTVSDDKPNLKIVGLIHWPKRFSKGDRVNTSFRLENSGRVAAKKVDVILYLNGEEKNKVEDITIPSGGYAEIEIPWIAVKGKNDVDIEVKQGK